MANELPVVLILAFADARHEKRNLNGRSLPGYDAHRPAEPRLRDKARQRPSSAAGIYISAAAPRVSLRTPDRRLRGGEFVSPYGVVLTREGVK